MKTRMFKAIFGLAFSTTLTTLSAAATTGSYTTDPVASGYFDLLSWPFKAEDITHIFGTNDQALEIFIYSNNTYYISQIDGPAFDPNFVLQPGQGFFVWNGDTVTETYTLTGTNLTSASISLFLPSTNYNMVSPAFLGTNNEYLECIYAGTPDYPNASLHYISHTNDLVSQWSLENQAWVNYKVVPNSIISPYYTNLTGDNLVFGTTPGVCIGQGLLIKPFSDTTWVQ